MEGGVVSALKGNRRCRNACRKRREAMEESNKATIRTIAALRLTTAKHKQPGRLEQHARRKAYTPVRANNPTNQARDLWIDRVKKTVLCVLVSLWLTQTSRKEPCRSGHRPDGMNTPWHRVDDSTCQIRNLFLGRLKKAILCALVPCSSGDALLNSTVVRNRIELNKASPELELGTSRNLGATAL